MDYQRDTEWIIYVVVVFSMEYQWITSLDSFQCDVVHADRFRLQQTVHDYHKFSWYIPIIVGDSC